MSRAGGPATTALLPAPSPEAVAAIVADSQAAFAMTEPVGGVAVVGGAGAKVAVKCGHLVVEDGIGSTRRTRRFPRVGGELRRLVIEARSGYLSLEAVAWCHAIGVEVTVLASDDEIALASAESRADGRLHRAQAVAGMSDTHPTGLAVVQMLLEGKLEGHERVARDRLGRPEIADTIAALAGGMEVAASIEECRQLEASAAACYWGAWAGHPAAVPRFRPSDRATLPLAWATFEGRRSVVSSGNSNRRATDPTNAMVNYLAALAKMAAVRACHVVGLDPDMGLLHLDAAGRPGLALDLIEPVRSKVEGYALDLLAGRTLRRRDFIEQADGSVRLGHELRQELAGTRDGWDQEVAPWAERTAKMLGKLVATDYRATQPLTGQGRRVAAQRVKARKAAAGVARVVAAEQAGVTRTEPATLALWSCPECGGQVDNPRRVRCEACIAKDPRQTPQLRQSRARAISSRRQAEAGWSAHHPAGPVDTTWARETLLPALAGVKLSEITAATGVAKSTASGWRKGAVSHPMHWPALAALVGVEYPSEVSC